MKKLVLVHIGHLIARHGDMGKGIADITGVYDGELVFAEELMSIPMER